MDLLDKLSSVFRKKKTTYEKKAAPPVEVEEPAITTQEPDNKEGPTNGTFLTQQTNGSKPVEQTPPFQSKLLDRIRNRLDGKEQDHSISDTESDENTAAGKEALPTQLLSYGTQKIFDKGAENEDEEVQEEDLEIELTQRLAYTQKIDASANMDKDNDVGVPEKSKEGIFGVRSADELSDKSLNHLDSGFVTQPMQSNTETQPTQINTVTQPTQINTETQPTQINTETQPTQINTVTQPTQINSITQLTENIFDMQPAGDFESRSNSNLQNPNVSENIFEMKNSSFVKTQKDPTQLHKSNNEKVIPYNTAKNALVEATQPTQLYKDALSQETQYETQPLQIHEYNKILEEEEKMQNKQTEHLVPKQVKVGKTTPLVFTKNKLLEMFDSDEESDEDEEATNVATAAAIQLTEKQPTKAELELKKLKTNIDTDSILKNFAKTEVINLDKSDEEVDSDLAELEFDEEDAVLKASSSKAAVFAIKAKLAKKLFNNSSTFKKPKNAQATMFQQLHKANVKQILDHRKEFVESKGLTLADIEKEKEEVENLLEQEIERNLRIRAKEKERERLAALKKEKPEKAEYEGDDDDESIYSSDYSQESDRESLNHENKLGEDFEMHESSGKVGDEINVDGEEEPESPDSMNEAPGNSTTVPSSQVQYASEVTYGFAVNEEKHSLKATAVELDVETEIEPLVDMKSMTDLQPPNQKETLIKSMINGIGELSESDSDVDLEESDQDSDDEDEASYKARMQQALAKKKEQEQKAQKLRTEMRQGGYGAFFDNEAEESEDEWAGLGGADGDGNDDDEYDSDLERMVDDFTKQKFNPDEIRQLIAAEDKQYDEQMVNKILHDLKNGGFRKRGQGAMDLELSDEEDDELSIFRKKRREQLQQKMLESRGELATKKSSAFFETMEDLDQVDDPFAVNELIQEAKDRVSEAANTPGKTVISKEFVTKTLSFLTNRDDDHQDEFELAKLQHAAEPGNLEDDDFYSIKSKLSFTKTSSNVSFNSRIEVNDDDDEDEDDEFDILSSLSKRSLFAKSKGMNDANSKFKEGTKSVKISNAYKTVGGSKASVTYLGTKRKLKAPSQSKKRKLLPKIPSSSLFKNSAKGFD
ncbi:hypothetical protein ACO0QE_002304 [Hanseniaspora vineae]